jgi:hypothetical protein
VAVWLALFAIAVAVIVILVKLVPELTISTLAIVAVVLLAVGAISYIVWLNRQDQPLWRNGKKARLFLDSRLFGGERRNPPDRVID